MSRPTVEVLEEHMQSTDDQLFGEHKAAIAALANRVGFSFAPLSGFTLLNGWDDCDRTFIDEEMFSVIYGEDVDRHGSAATVMRFTMFALSPISDSKDEFDNVAKAYIEPENDVSRVPTADDLNEGGTDITKVYEDVVSYLEVDPSNADLLQLVVGMSEIEVVEKLIDCALPITDGRKKRKWMLIQGHERAGSYLTNTSISKL